MSIILEIGERSKRDTMWHRFRKECIYGKTDPSKFSDETFVDRRDKELEKVGARWIQTESTEYYTASMFQIEFEHEKDATAFILKWS
jgi:hypothetical protein